MTAWCAQQGVLAEELHVGRRSLEDVFLELTGRELRCDHVPAGTFTPAPGRGRVGTMLPVHARPRPC